MSEDDRAAKAARARKRWQLKKRQQKKAAGSSASGVTSPTSPPPSRPFTPAVSEAPPVEAEKRDLADLFSAHDPNDNSWISSLQRAVSPSASTSPPPAPAPTSPTLRPGRMSLSSAGHADTAHDAELQARIHSLQADNTALTAQIKESGEKVRHTEALLQEDYSRLQELQSDVQKLHEEMETMRRNEQQTVSLLVSEKVSLTSNLERLEGLEGEADSIKQQLQDEKAQSSNLQQRLRTAQVEVDKSSLENEQLREKERELTEKTREQERLLQVSNATSASLQKEVDEQKRRFRELEEQIQADDRLEKLENTLKNTQDRTADLELQLSKQKQVCIIHQLWYITEEHVGFYFLERRARSHQR
ncbi:hypothetical protein BDZ89DRAFT_1137774 [Hymenopellis radicata]|nr:hypothetical protein BDZ89DRAFT_1137774 [Hymenopellis radicata]